MYNNCQRQQNRISESDLRRRSSIRLAFQRNNEESQTRSLQNALNDQVSVFTLISVEEYYTRDRVMGFEPSVAARATAWSTLRTNKGTDGYAVCVCEVG